MKSPNHIMLNGYKHISFESEIFSEIELTEKSKTFYNWLDKRRSIRDFSDTPVPKQVIENLIKSASTAPSGAHKQPWTFCAISNPLLKTKIRKAAEIEEQESYTSRMSERWKKDLAPLATDMNKPFLETAPWLIVAFKKAYELDENGEKNNNYYVSESVGIACGMLISAIHNAGLVTLTHTPSPMNFLSKLLNRPSNERAFLLLPVGYPKFPTYVPDLKRKDLDEISAFYE
ncbi:MULTISPECIES: nitroreductase family protein [unclassified Algibacter]|uniref:nitroreductase family protein n=1 Tax=unclassified Algibacter TaxID=2615009 RepID=UPI00131D47F5|nr:MULTISPECIES: nitroreductase family protein [unclassified Algibacter]MCL5130315.1 nitroreductase family protein [Algibacter sp. L4_22]